MKHELKEALTIYQKKISLQHKTKPKNGKGEIYWFENEHIGLKRTLFHRFNIPLIPFDSGLEYEEFNFSTVVKLETEIKE